eukprot:CAMPEP_0115129396 /NCGR_PEP_ID=MMETSP0227-20121206/51763_1 /TAXON_ID=89957 /ORGANISM="Polarella glacialis, Strain CCMP 1383" /LENGTH=45 /DNA_ID= /DNA_START= /DNA_END= /DNA_ORIENTATION=
MGGPASKKESPPANTAANAKIVQMSPNPVASFLSQVVLPSGSTQF